MNSTIGAAIIKVTNYSATLTPRQVIETPLLPAYNALQTRNTIMQSTGYGRDKYTITCYTTSYEYFSTLLNYWKNFTSVALNLYVQNVTIVNNLTVKISNFSYSVSIDDTIKGQCKYNIQIECITI